MITLCLCAILYLSGSTDPEIRIANRSNIPIEHVRVDFPSQSEQYGTIPPKAVTEYRAVRKAYRYARIVAVVRGEEVLIQPFDFVGEKELKSGKYTYVLSINEKATSKYNRLKLKLKRD